MKTFQLTLKGFNTNKKTDHLIKWINAPTKKALAIYLNNHLDIELQEPPIEIALRNKDDGVDVALSIMGKVIVEMNPKIAVFVSGGVVQEIRATIPDIQVELINFDNLEETKNKNLDKLNEEAIQKYPHIIF